MQHDVDYSVCKDDKKCKHCADRKMVKALDAVYPGIRDNGVIGSLEILLILKEN